MPYLGQFLFDFKKLGTVMIRKARSLIWVPNLFICNDIEKNQISGLNNLSRPKLQCKWLRTFKIVLKGREIMNGY